MAKVYIGETEITVQGEGLSQTEKNLILTLFEKSAYAEDDAETAYTALSELWAGYDITWVGSGFAKSNSATSVSAGASFTSTVTANAGFTVTNVTVTMGGSEVQGAWSNGTVTIPNVTGNIVITVTTSQVAVSSISAVYTQSGTVYTDDSLDSLKSDLVVTATFMDSSTGVIASEDYTLSGTLTEGTSTITVSYGGKTTTFSVTVTERKTVQVVLGSLDTNGAETEATNRARTSAIDVDLSVEALGSNVTMNIVGISSTSGQLTANTARLASQRIPVTGGNSISVSVASGYYIKVFAYKATSALTGSGIGNLTSNTASGTVPSDAVYARILIKKSDNTNMSATDIANLSLSINGTSYGAVQGHVGDINISSEALVNGGYGYFFQHGYDSSSAFVSGGLDGVTTYSDGTVKEFSGVPMSTSKVRFVFRKNNSGSSDPNITSLSGKITVNGIDYELIFS